MYNTFYTVCVYVRKGPILQACCEVDLRTKIT